MNDRDAYLSFADEMDPHGASVEPVWNEADWDLPLVRQAEDYARRNALPWPPMDGIDEALRRVSRVDLSESEQRLMDGNR